MWVGIGVGIGRNRFATGIFNDYALRVTADGGITEAGQCVDAVTGLLLNASLLLIPSGYKGGKLYSEIPTNGNGDLTWTRGGDAFRTNASGVLQRVPWNLVQYSEDFTNAIWSKEQITVTANSTSAPNGTTTADTLVENTANAVHRASYYPANTISGNSYTMSLYLKNNGRRYLYINCRNAFNAGSTFDLLNGTVSTVGIGTASIENIGNGWYRCSVTGTCTTTGAYSMYYQLNNSGVATDTTYTGDGTSGIYIWGAQLVEGTTAQTYLPTTDRLNFPRLSYMYGSCPSALLEPQRTNLLWQSETFDNATWSKTAVSVTANTTTSPDGNTNADTFTGDGTSSIKNLIQTATSTLTSGVRYCTSVYVKKNTNNFFQIIGTANAYSSGTFANFDLNNGVVGTIGGSGTEANIVNVGNGWYRCTMIATTNNTTGANIAIFGLITSATSARGEVNTLSTSVFIYGAQLEVGAYPTTYIPTTSATATRVADAFSRSNIYTNGLISASGGTWFVELRNNVAYTRDATTRLGIGDTTALTTNSIQFGVSSGGSFRLQIVTFVGGSGNTIYTTTTDTVKIAIKWNGTSADIFANGTKVVSATSFTTTNMENFVTNGIGVPFFIQQMALFPTPLTDAQCQTLTT